MAIFLFSSLINEDSESYSKSSTDKVHDFAESLSLMASVSGAD